jgi:signal transduction histidine kinase
LDDFGRLRYALESAMSVWAKSEGVNPARQVETLEALVVDLKRRIEVLEDEKVALEKETVRRGIKLNCTNIALARAKIAFDETARRREEMVLDASHDLRTPLTSIKGAAQNLLDGIAGDLTEDQREYVDIVRQHAERLIGIVNGLMEALRITLAPIELETERVDLGRLADEVARGLMPLAVERGIALTVQAPALLAVADEARLRQVLENLVGNALKFGRRGDRVTVAVHGDSERAEISVRDTGPGLTPEELTRVFDRFYRGRSGTAGSGVGLAISREIMRAHGGELSVVSERGKGSEFLATLPLSPVELTPS